MGGTDFVNQSASERGMNVIAGRTFNQSSYSTPNIAAHHWTFVNSLKGVKQIAMWFPPVSRIFRRAVEAPVHQVSLAMHIALRMTNRLMVVNRDMARASVHRTEMLLHRTEAVLRVLQRQRLLELRVSEQREAPRPETGLSTQVLTHDLVERYMGAPRIAMTFSKPHRADPSESLTVNPIEVKADVGRRIRREIDATRSSVRTPITLPDQELSRVTDHVIRQLDRRVLSYCERTGRA
jgi:hypothetical protein